MDYRELFSSQEFRELLNEYERAEQQGYTPLLSSDDYTDIAEYYHYKGDFDRALQIIDSAEIVGNMSDFRAELLRVHVYAYPGDAMNLDTARQMGVALLEHDSVKGSVENRTLRTTKITPISWSCQRREVSLPSGPVLQTSAG